MSDGVCGLPVGVFALVPWADLLRLLCADYGNPSYWDERYAKHFDADADAHFDWYLPYDALAGFLTPYFNAEADYEILVPGCGNSDLGARLYDQGYVNITNIDISEVVVNLMSERYTDREEMECTDE
jgi:hypothetical protein